MIPPAQVRAALPELQAVSEDWLADKRASEKGFSLGAFDPEYIPAASRCPASSRTSRS